MRVNAPLGRNRELERAREREREIVKKMLLGRRMKAPADKSMKRVRIAWCP
jgi:hypothetical protein